MTRRDGQTSKSNSPRGLPSRQGNSCSAGPSHAAPSPPPSIDTCSREGDAWKGATASLSLSLSLSVPRGFSTLVGDREDPIHVPASLCTHWLLADVDLTLLLSLFVMQAICTLLPTQGRNPEAGSQAGN